MDSECDKVRPSIELWNMDQTRRYLGSKNGKFIRLMNGLLHVTVNALSDGIRRISEALSTVVMTLEPRLCVTPETPSANALLRQTYELF